MKLKSILFSFVFLLFIWSCKPEKSSRIIHSEISIVKNKYAGLFEIRKSEKYTQVIIRNLPEENPIDEFFLVDKKIDIPDEISDNKIIRVPVQKVVCLSTTHISFIDLLNKTATIKAVSGSNYVNNKQVIQNIENGKVIDIGYEENIDIEQLITINPDVVFAYNIGNNLSSIITKAEKLKIPFVTINEYRENSILGQTEWLKLFAEFYKETENADSIYNKIVTEYNTVSKLCETVTNRPTILANMPWKADWHIPGGRSYIAQLINDAGGNYLWKEDSTIHNIASTTEKVYKKASKAQIWINPGQANSLNEIINTDTRLSGFEPYKKGEVYNCNAKKNANGSPEYYETSVVKPQILLKDLVKIFHPELLPNYELYYYQKLK